MRSCLTPLMRCAHACRRALAATPPAVLVDGGVGLVEGVSALAVCALRSVERLLARCRPSAIVRGVRTIVVLPVDRQARWPQAHILQEGREVIAPSIAHRYASGAVPLELIVRRVVAALLRLAPGFVRLLVASVSGGAAEASATYRRSGNQVIPGHALGLAALATASPFKAVRLDRVGGDNSQDAVRGSDDHLVFALLADFGLKASATLRASCAQIATLCERVQPARADAAPLLFDVALSKNRQASINIPSDVGHSLILAWGYAVPV